MDVPPADTASLLEVRCYFVRHRNALLVRASFSPLFVDYYLHLMEIAAKHPPQLDAMLKEALVGVVMHAASRPRNERHAWTVNFQHPLANFFVTADNTTAFVTGRVFTEDIKRAERNVFYAQAQKHPEEPRLSAIEIDGVEALLRETSMAVPKPVGWRRSTAGIRLADEASCCRLISRRSPICCGFTPALAIQ